MKALLAVIMFCATACIIRGEQAQSKFIVMPNNVMDGAVKWDDVKFLIRDIFKPQWKIGLRYHADCTPTERRNRQDLMDAILVSVRAWLKPLKELQLKRPIVDRFVYELQADFNPANPTDLFSADQNEDFAEWQRVDLRVTFACTKGVSYALSGSYPPAVVMYVMELGGEIKPWTLFTLNHELGHAFGLADTYDSGGLMQSRGGLHLTAGRQPASAMSSGQYFFDDGSGDDPRSIGEDDKRGIIWLYKYFFENQPTEDCFFADYVYVEDMNSCEPRHPLIFAAKHNFYIHALNTLKDDPTIDINAQDVGGMTALHYAAMHGKMPLVKALLARKDIKPSLQNKYGNTPFDLALEAGHSEIVQMLPTPPRCKEDVNGDYVVNILDLIAVAQKFGQQDTGNADVNGDGTINIADLVLVASAFSSAASAPMLQATPSLTAATVSGWLSAAQSLTSQVDYARGLYNLQQLYDELSSSKTRLLTNYPNPFNPETWLPYQLGKDAQVSIRIYDTHGVLVRTLALGHQRAGIYQDKSRAAYWNGRNEQGELVASGVYFYTLSAGDFTASGKMLLRK